MVGLKSIASLAGGKEYGNLPMKSCSRSGGWSRRQHARRRRNSFQRSRRVRCLKDTLFLKKMRCAATGADFPAGSLESLGHFDGSTASFRYERFSILHIAVRWGADVQRRYHAAQGIHDGKAGTGCAVDIAVHAFGIPLFAKGFQRIAKSSGVGNGVLGKTFEFCLTKPFV